MEFGILGPLYVTDDSGSPATPTAPKPRKVLALLLLEANKMVPTETLVRELWEDVPPRSALSTLQTYIFQIRRFLHASQPAGRPHDRLVTTPLGYMLKIRPGELDLHSFEADMLESKSAIRRGEHEAASALLRRGLALWRGTAFCDVRTGPLLEIGALQLTERWLAAQQLRISVDLLLGRHMELVGELTGLTAQHPHHETLHSQLMLTLHLSGRRSEALEAFTRLRDELVNELGIEPSSTIRHMHDLILRGDASLSEGRQPPEYLAALGIS
jgi:DNA-binding SARP family transcriptional activator